MRMLLLGIIYSLIMVATSGCGTRLASPYDSISDDILTQTYLTLIRVKHRTAKRRERCMDSAQRRDFELSAVNFEVLIARYLTRPGVGDTVDRLKRLKSLVTIHSKDTVGTINEVMLCSDDYWKEVDKGFEAVWIVEQSKRSSRNEILQLIFGYQNPQPR